MTYMVENEYGELLPGIEGRINRYGMTPRAAFADFVSEADMTQSYALVSVEITRLTPAVNIDSLHSDMAYWEA